VTTTADWAQWEKQVINGVFPLHRAVSYSDHSVVFLTEHKGLLREVFSCLLTTGCVCTLGGGRRKIEVVLRHCGQDAQLLKFGFARCNASREATSITRNGRPTERTCGG
jgi:hypothetical protein